MNFEVEESGWSADAEPEWTETRRIDPRRIGRLFGLSMKTMIRVGLFEPTLADWQQAEREEIARRRIRARIRRLIKRLR